MTNPTTLKFDLSPDLNELDLENIQNTLPYVSEAIVSFRIVGRIAGSGSLEVSLRPNSDAGVAQERISRHLEKIRPIGGQDAVKVVFDQMNVVPANRSDILPLLLEKRDLIPHAPGIYSLHGKLQQMYQALDRAAFRFAQTQGAREAIYPVTIGLPTLRKSNFFSSYPHFANFISTLRDDSEKISSLSSHPDFSSILRAPETMCRSAGCLHSYPSFENQVLKREFNDCITMSGRIFRNESLNVHGLERLNEYGMREIIYFGSPDHVQARLKECGGWFEGFMKENGLQGRIQVANDPFFADNLATLQHFQRSQQSKLEARLVNPFNGRQISVGSMNYHGTHFSKAYNIRFEGDDYISSGCVGFGMERTIFLVLAQYGYDETSWPESLRSMFFS